LWRSLPLQSALKLTNRKVKELNPQMSLASEVVLLKSNLMVDLLMRLAFSRKCLETNLFISAAQK